MSVLKWAYTAHYMLLQSMARINKDIVASLVFFSKPWLIQCTYNLTHCGVDEMTIILDTAFSNTIFWIWKLSIVIIILKFVSRRVIDNNTILWLYHLIQEMLMGFIW